MINCSNRRFWSHYSCSDGPKVPSLTNWKWTKIAFWHLIIIFEDKIKRTRNAFSKKLLHMIWKPANTFQKIRPYEVVKHKFWKTWLLFYFVQIDSKWEEEITQEDHHSWIEENWEKILKFFKILEIPRKAFYLLNPSKLNHELCNGLFSFFQKRVARLDSRARPFYWKTHPIVNWTILGRHTDRFTGKLIH